MSENASPSFQLPEVEPRRPIVWPIVALAVFLLVVANALATRESPRGNPDLTAHELILEQAVRMKRFAPMLGKRGSQTRTDAARRAHSLLDRPISELVDLPDPEAAALYAAMRHEQGRSILPERLALIARRGTSRQKAIAAIYESQALTRDRLREIESRLGDGILDRVAIGHARVKAGQPARWDQLFPIGRWIAQSIAIGTVVIACFGGIAIWIAYLRARARGRWVPLGWPTGLIPLGAADRLGMRFLVFLILFPALSSLLGPGLFRLLGNSGAILAGSLAMLAAGLFCLRARVLGKRGKLDEVIGVRRPLGRLAMIGVAGALAEVPLVLATLGVSLFLSRWFPSPGHPAQDLLRAPTVLSIFAFVFAGVMVAPLIEELIFRGLLAPALSRLRGPFFGILASSFVFAAMHPQGIAGWPPLMAVGATCAMVAYQTRSIVPAIVTHAIHNGFMLLLGLVVA